MTTPASPFEPEGTRGWNTISIFPESSRISIFGFRVKGTAEFDEIVFPMTEPSRYSIRVKRPSGGTNDKALSRDHLGKLKMNKLNFKSTGEESYTEHMGETSSQPGSEDWGMLEEYRVSL